MLTHPNMRTDFRSYEEYRLAVDEWKELPASADKWNATAKYKKEMEKNMTDKIKFAEGVKITKKEGKYGSFYKVGININDFCEKNPMNERGWVNFTIFEGKESGKPYAQLDTYGTENNNITKIAEISDDEIPF